MAEVKYQFDGIARLNATLLFAAMAASPVAFLTTGLLGKFVFMVLTHIGNWLANQGLALLNIGVDMIKIHFEKKDYDEAMEEALAVKDMIIKTGRKLTPQEVEDIDGKVKNAFRKFAILA